MTSVLDVGRKERQTAKRSISPFYGTLLLLLLFPLDRLLTFFYSIGRRGERERQKRNDLDDDAAAALVFSTRSNSRGEKEKREKSLLPWRRFIFVDIVGGNKNNIYLSTYSAVYKQHRVGLQKRASWAVLLSIKYMCVYTCFSIFVRIDWIFLPARLFFFFFFFFSRHLIFSISAMKNNGTTDVFYYYRKAGRLGGRVSGIDCDCSCITQKCITRLF